MFEIHSSIILFELILSTLKGFFQSMMEIIINFQSANNINEIVQLIV